MFESYVAPTETVAFHPGWNRKPQREVESRWVLNPVPKGQADATEPVVRATLTTHHDPDSKVFRTSLTWKVVRPVEPGSMFSMTTWSSDHHMVQVGRTEVARYSQKAIKAEHAEMLRVVEEGWLSDKVQAVFTQAQAAVPVTEEV